MSVGHQGAVRVPEAFVALNPDMRRALADAVELEVIGLVPDVRLELVSSFSRFHINRLSSNYSHALMLAPVALLGYDAHVNLWRDVDWVAAAFGAETDHVTETVTPLSQVGEEEVIVSAGTESVPAASATASIGTAS